VKNRKILAISGYFTPIICRTIFTLNYSIWQFLYIDIPFVKSPTQSPEIELADPLYGATAPKEGASA
jgi:hypothetical protein